MNLAMRLVKIVVTLLGLSTVRATSPSPSPPPPVQTNDCLGAGGLPSAGTVRMDFGNADLTVNNLYCYGPDTVTLGLDVELDRCKRGACGHGVFKNWRVLAVASPRRKILFAAHMPANSGSVPASSRKCTQNCGNAALARARAPFFRSQECPRPRRAVASPRSSPRR